VTTAADGTGISFRLTGEQLELQHLARTFAAEEVRPRCRELDRVADPGLAYPTDLILRASELGLRTLTLPREYGGRAANAVTQAIVLEELCVGDAGFGMSLLHGWREGLALATETTAEQRERFLPAFASDPSYVTSLGLSEPHAGSDHVLPYTGDVFAGARTSAVIDGDEWVLNGTKRLISNAGVSKLLILMARTDPAVPWNQGVSLFLVPTDSPGFRAGAPEDKLGLRVNRNAEIHLEDCRIPLENVLGQVNEGAAVLARLAKGSLFKEGVKSIGVARAAYEEALSWCGQRVQGGKPIIEHQAVQASLAEMATGIEAAKSLAWRVAWAVENDPASAVALEPMVKIFAGEVAVRCAINALELHGGFGVLRQNYVEKLVRDAVTMLHAFGGNHALRSRLAAALVSRP
jgi:alkylation response protein AidB-like acyl-CoA dehydrogenase